MDILPYANLRHMDFLFTLIINTEWQQNTPAKSNQILRFLQELEFDKGIVDILLFIIYVYIIVATNKNRTSEPMVEYQE